MHEVSIIQQTLDIALQQAQLANASKIHRLKMRVGALSGVIPDALTFAFDVVTQGTIAEGAQLEIDDIPIVCYCRTCRQEFHPQDIVYECPHCQQLSHEIHQGKELELISMEIS